MRFVDANVLLYAVSTAADERQKHEVALRVLGSNDLALSVQVLQEFYVQATRPSKLDHLDHGQAADLVEAWLRFAVQDNTVAILRAAMSTKIRWGISYWDAAIVEAARAAGCATLLTEDLQDGMDFAGVRVVDRFW